MRRGWVYAVVTVVGVWGVGWCVPRGVAQEQQPGWTAVSFTMQPRDAAMPGWTIRMSASGFGSYQETGGTPQPIRGAQATLTRLGGGGAAVTSGHCETHLKHIANTGQKTIAYTLSGASKSCTFNFSDDDGLMSTASAFEALAATMQAGEKMQHDLRYDRLALDDDMQGFVDEVKAGRAMEVGNIATVLRQLSGDDRVMERVRRDAVRLLQDAGVAAQHAGEAAPGEVSSR